MVPTNFSVDVVTNIATVGITINWDSAFNSANNVTSYRLETVSSAGGSSSVFCPSSCNSSGPCRCSGLGIGNNTNITISAINCGDQMGPPVSITAMPQGNQCILINM